MSSELISNTDVNSEIEARANCWKQQSTSRIMTQSTPDKVIIVNKREFDPKSSPSQRLSNKRFKPENQLVPIGIACITSPTKSPRKKCLTPQKNTLSNYFEISPSKRSSSSTSKTEDIPKKNLTRVDFTECKMETKMSQSSDSSESFLASPSMLELEMCKINSQDVPMKVNDSCVSTDDELEQCEMPTTPEKLNEMVKWMENERKLSQPSCSKSPLKTEIFKNNLQEIPRKANDPTCYFPPDEDIEQCDMPTTEEKLHQMQTEMWKMWKRNKWKRKYSQKSILVESWTILPDHVLENIFCCLPIRKLCSEVNRVCKRWNNIISNLHFIAWKKRYFKLKSDNQLVNEEIANICLRENMAHNTVCLVGVIRYMKSFNFSTKNSLLPAINKHSKYKWAISLLNERAPECIEDEVPYVGSVIAALCILCSDVREILEILNCLTHPSSDCSVVNALESLYCLATLFYYFKRKFSINPGFHYRVYYALYHFESVSHITGNQTNNGGQQRIQRNAFTHEQFQIINHPLGPNQVVKIVAFAGTGKTTTLVEFTKKWPKNKFLNICFNSSVETNAKQIFPGHVTSKTIHSIAFGAVGINYKLAGKFNHGALYPYNFTECLEGPNKLVRAAMALKTIACFTTTADEFITTTHVPSWRKHKDEIITFKVEEKIAYRDDAIVIWDLMIDLKKKEVKISHDVYLKIYQLSSCKFEKFDCLLIDEAQDLNPAMVDIVNRQSYSKVIVGDPNQQIYSFRGAVNTLSSIEGTHMYYLTQSFRFGPEIAYMASCTLEIMKQEHKNTIVGTLEEGKISGERIGQVAILARTRFSLFAEAVKFCDNNSVLRGAFLGTLEKYNYNMINEIYNLSRGNFVSNRFIKRFDSISSLRAFAESVQDVELIGNITIVECYTTRIPEIMRQLKQRCNNLLGNADVVFSTTHKAKGHEFDTVILTDDFIRETVKNIDGVLSCRQENDDDESNILYVALTRAKHRLVISKPVVEMLLLSGERFEHFIRTEGLENKSCIKCGISLVDTMRRNFALERENINLSCDFSIGGGPLCFNCATNQVLNICDFIRGFPINLMLVNDNIRPSLSSLVGPLVEE